MQASSHTDPHTDQWRRFLKSCGDMAANAQPFQVSGSLTRVTGLVMEAVGLKLAVGSGCTVLTPNGNRVEAEVVGFQGDRLYLMPNTDVFGLTPGAKVIPWSNTHVPVLDDVWPATTSRLRPAQAFPGGKRATGARTGRCRTPAGWFGTAAGGAWRAARQQTAQSARSGPDKSDIWMSACARSTRCSRSDAASAWACSPAPASARACCSA